MSRTAEDMISFLPSPASSTCDSLDDIDDLEAFLDAQGQLSHFPTPPPYMKDVTIIHEVEIDLSDDEEELDYYHIATRFTCEASIGIEFSDIDVRMIERMLVRARLPPEVLALAYNLICGLDCHSLPIESFYSAPNDLIVVAALSLAVSYTNDQPPTPKYWSRHVCDGAWTPVRIDKTTLEVFAALEWQLHEHSAPDAIRRALSAFSSSASHIPQVVQPHKQWGPWSCAGIEQKQQLKLVVEEASAIWVNGQVTPDGTPPKYGVAAVKHQFLPLL